MSLPQLLARVLIQGSQILGKAFVEAGRQAGRNLRATPESAQATAGARPGQGGAADAKSDQLTRTHRMTVEEARMILNVKAPEGGSGAEITEEIRQQLTKAYDHLFSVNAPPAPKGQKGGGSGSFYMQSKVVRAKQRIEAEWEELAKKAGAGAQEGAAEAGASGSTAAEGGNGASKAATGSAEGRAQAGGDKAGPKDS